MAAACQVADAPTSTDDGGGARGPRWSSPAGHATTPAMNPPSAPGARNATSTTVATTVMTVFIAVVWGANGLWAKILGQVPRHAQIVARVVGADLAPALTILIGISELVMLAWFLSRRWARLNTAAQVGIVMTMNVIEQVVAGDLLLFGPLNLVLAGVFCIVVVVRHRLVTARSGE